jgi:integrase
MGKLTAKKVETLKEPGRYGDGGGLYLQVTKSEKKERNSAPAKSWIFRYRLDGHRSQSGKPLSREMGLGSVHVMGLADARQEATELRTLLRKGADPIEAKREARRTAAVDRAKALTFRKASEAYISAHRAGWKNPKHAAQWPSTLETYVYSVFGDLPVQSIDVGLVMKVVEPLWSVKPETASRVRGRIEVILDWAKVRGYRSGDNPARWRGHLDKLLPKKSKVRKVEHHAALPYLDAGAFMAELREREAIAARALEFTILTAARTSETIGARWDEFDLTAKVWTVPAARMKAGREHRVPLSQAVLAVLQDMQEFRQNEFVFPGNHRDVLSNMAMDMLLRRMDRDVTVHGFRSTFRDWAAERSNFPREVAEAALAHTLADKTEAAYLRGDMFSKRRRLMDAWSDYCSKPQPEKSAGNVTRLHAL